jgi:hypothetical protein
LRAADALPLTYFAGLVSLAALASMMATRRFQRLGDLVADTMVVVSERAAGADVIRLAPPARPEELALLPGEVRLDPDERLAIEMFLRRRHRLGPAREYELASALTPLVRARYGYLGAIDPSRALALLYDRASNPDRRESLPPPSMPESWRR